MIVRSGERILLIERGKEPYGFAVPAGHVDGDASFEIAAARELKEEVGLDAKDLKLAIQGRKENKCRREDGAWHFWKIYEVEADGQIKGCEDETKQVGWYTIDQIKELARRTEKYLNKEVSEEDWQNAPGLEPIMRDWFTELKII